MRSEENLPLIVGISGASGAPLALDVLRALREAEIPVRLVISRGGEYTLRQECGLTPDDLRKLCGRLYDNEDIGGDIASGTCPARGMLIVPCSMKTLAGVAGGYSDTLLLRAADVTLKERRRLVLCCRETPLSLIHIRNMLAATEAGAVIAPPMPAYYTHPETVGEMTHHMTGKLLALFGIEAENFRRWEGMP